MSNTTRHGRRWQHARLRDTALHRRQWRYAWLRGFARCVLHWTHPLSAMHSSQSHWSHPHIWLKFKSCTSLHLHVRVFSLLWPFPWTSLSSCRPCSFSFFLFLTNKKILANLYNSAKQGVDTNDVLSFPTETIKTIFRIIVSANQPSLYGAVAEICEEYESFHDKSVRFVIMGQSSSSLVLSAFKTEVSLETDDLADQNFLLQQIWKQNWKAFTTR